MSEAGRRQGADKPGFSLDEVIVDSPQAAPRLVVKFRWDGEDPLFAVLALGYTLSNAVREPRDGIVWLRWIPVNDR